MCGWEEWRRCREADRTMDARPARPRPRHGITSHQTTTTNDERRPAAATKAIADPVQRGKEKKAPYRAMLPRLRVFRIG